MTFEAYITNIRAKGPKEFFDEAVQLGVLNAGTKTMEFVAWLKASSGLRHGHAMAIWEAFKRNGWVPMSGSGVSAAKRRIQR